MKWGVVCVPLILAMAGCANVSEINETLPTMSVISGKKPQEYAQCLTDKLADSRGALQVQPQKDGVRVIVPVNFLQARQPCLISKIAPAAAASSCMSACPTCRFALAMCRKPRTPVFPADRLANISTRCRHSPAVAALSFMES